MYQKKVDIPWMKNGRLDVPDSFKRYFPELADEYLTTKLARMQRVHGDRWGMTMIYKAEHRWNWEGRMSMWFCKSLYVTYAVLFCIIWAVSLPGEFSSTESYAERAEMLKKHVPVVHSYILTVMELIKNQTNFDPIHLDYKSIDQLGWSNYASMVVFLYFLFSVMKIHFCHIIDHSEWKELQRTISHAEPNCRLTCRHVSIVTFIGVFVLYYIALKAVSVVHMAKSKLPMNEDEFLKWQVEEQLYYTVFLYMVLVLHRGLIQYQNICQIRTGLSLLKIQDDRVFQEYVTKFCGCDFFVFCFFAILLQFPFFMVILWGTSYFRDIPGLKKMPFYPKLLKLISR